MSSSHAEVSCPNCASGSETFWYMAHKYLYDVDQARQIVSDGRESVELDDESVQFSVKTSEINQQHLPHVNTEFPGIIAHIHYRTDEAEMVYGHLLIDGHHRAARCLELKIPFYVYLLTEEESEEILLRSPLKAELQNT
ncbi:MAG: hypothetical protein JWM11_61 [Planctomycetaceae bacterium]|nr:hypothetical protein [Planctomycetaceae bacterium]